VSDVVADIVTRHCESNPQSPFCIIGSPLPQYEGVTEDLSEGLDTQRYEDFNVSIMDAAEKQEQGPFPFVSNQKWKEAYNNYVRENGYRKIHMIHSNGRTFLKIAGYVNPPVSEDMGHVYNNNVPTYWKNIGGYESYRLAYKPRINLFSVEIVVRAGNETITIERERVGNIVRITFNIVRREVFRINTLVDTMDHMLQDMVGDIVQDTLEQMILEALQILIFKDENADNEHRVVFQTTPLKVRLFKIIPPQTDKLFNILWPSSVNDLGITSRIGRAIGFQSMSPKEQRKLRKAIQSELETQIEI
jgi:hypothetical protein